jgi:hypothetical protein
MLEFIELGVEVFIDVGVEVLIEDIPDPVQRESTRIPSQFWPLPAAFIVWVWLVVCPWLVFCALGGGVVVLSCAKIIPAHSGMLVNAMASFICKPPVSSRGASANARIVCK